MALRQFMEKMELRGAGRKYACLLPPQIRKDYGASDFYNLHQIDKSAARAGLPTKYIAFGYALFLEEAAFRALDGSRFPASYEKLCSLLVRYKPESISAGFEPAAENFMAVNGSGEIHN